MKGYFWNSDKFGDITKHQFVKDTFQEHEFDILAIREDPGALPGTLPERGIPAGGLLHHHGCLRSDV
jgi:hypothetical protein